MSGITQNAVIRKILHQANRDEENDGPASICFEKDGRRFFIPKAPSGLIFTDDQIDLIERVLNDFGIDLLPLDSYPGLA